MVLFLLLFCPFFLLLQHAPDFFPPEKSRMFLEKIGFVLIFKKNIPQHSQVERTCIIGERESVCVLQCVLQCVCYSVCVCVCEQFIHTIHSNFFSSGFASVFTAD